MGKVTGFLEIDRRERKYQPAGDRVRHFNEFVIPLSKRDVSEQGARCMDCGIPYCHNGCPVNNIIPDWNDLVYRDEWRAALEVLHSTNNFPEFTGRICPAPCEEACTLNIDDNPVTIKTIECSIIDNGWEKGWISPQVPEEKTGKRVAVIGSGPAGMACSQQLARAGHTVDLYEEQMAAEGVNFHINTNVGVDIKASELLAEYDAVVLSGGSEKPRDLPVPGRDLEGVEFAMDFLPQQNRRVSDEPLGAIKPILANGKHVVVIGGGDTGSDCIGTSFRQGAVSVAQIEIMPMPPEKPDKGTTWPFWPQRMRTSSSQAEGADRDFSVMTKRLEGSGNHVEKLHAVRVDEKMQEIPGTEFELKADLVLLAMGFVHPVHDAATSGPAPTITKPRFRSCSPPAICGAVSRLSSGRSAKAGNARAQSISS
jgi:glutamate synthase (NADPH/NADH) small chain